MAQVNCTGEFDRFTEKLREWLAKSEELRDEEVSPEKVEELTELFQQVESSGRDFAKCEFKRE